MKGKIDQISHRTNAVFDQEFVLYQELCGKFYHLVCCTTMLFPNGLDTSAVGTSEEIKRVVIQRVNQTGEALTEASYCLGSRAPFIKENIYLSQNEILKLCNKQLFAYKFANPLKDQNSILAQNAFADTNRIQEKWNKIVTVIRDMVHDFEHTD